MRIALVYNPSSGRRVALESLRRLIVSEGHQLVREIEHLADASALADPPAELIVVAGGDGTVADALRAAAGRGLPIAVLPLGTANNIALSLGVHGQCRRQKADAAGDQQGAVSHVVVLQYGLREFEDAKSYQEARGF